MIIHTVAFKTRHPKGSPEERQVLRDGMALGNLPMVNGFQCFRQVGSKNPYDFGFSMEFESEHDYAEYNAHPQHVDFVENKWNLEVDSYIEIDYVKYEE